MNLMSRDLRGISSTAKGAVAISNETKVPGEFFQILEGHAHSHNAGADAAIIRYLIADHSPGCRINDQPDIAFDTEDFDVCLISSKGGSLLVRVGVDKGLDTDGGGLAVGGDHLVSFASEHGSSKDRFSYFQA